MMTIPTKTREEIDAYVLTGRQPNGFVTAVLANDLTQTFSQAEGENRKHLEDIVIYAYSHIPSSCKGSYEAVKAWCIRAKRTHEARNSSVA